MNNSAENVHIDISVSDPLWEGIENLETMAKNAVEQSLYSAQMPENLHGEELEVSLVFANDDLVQILNKEHRGIDKPTNVLSFAFLEDGENHTDGPLVSLGDVILAYETIEREAKEQGKYPRDHITHLLVHGTLHLLGYDHEDEDDATVMEILEIRILEKLGVQNPYTETHFMA